MTFSIAYNPATGAVDMSCSGLAAGITSVTFFWAYPGGPFNIVRGGLGVDASSGATIQVSHHDWPPGQDGNPTIKYGAWMSNNSWDGGDMVTLTLNASDQAWIKWLGFPFLNRRVRITDYTDPQRDGRNALLDVVRSPAPIAVQELMRARSFSFTVQTDTWDAWRDLDLALSVGGVMFLLADEEALGLPSVYFTVDKVSTRRERRHGSPRRWTTIDVSEVAAPSFLYAGAVSTWSSVRSGYATWQALMDAQPTWRDVLNMPASAEDIVVGDS